MQTLPLNREKYGYKRKTNACTVDLTFEIIFGVPLEQQTINHSIILTQWASFRLESKAYVECGVAGRFYQNQLGKGKNVFVTPDLKVPEFQQLIFKFSAQIRCLVEAWCPEQVVEVGKLGINTRFLLYMMMLDAMEWWQQASVFVIASEPGEKWMELCNTPFRNLNKAH